MARVVSSMLRASARPGDILREALVDAPDLQGAFIVGSTARGDTWPESDVDVFLIGSDPARTQAAYRLVEAELRMGREVDLIGYDIPELAARIESNNSFVERVLNEPQVWFRGSDQVLPLRSTT